MTVQNVTTRQIVVTSSDYEQLCALVESPQYRTLQPLLTTQLREELEQCKIVDPHKVPRGVVTMYSKVQVYDPALDETETYTLVYPHEADINEGRLSVLAPMGMALLGAKVGETVNFEAPAGMRQLKIKKILYQPEAAGDFDL